MPHEIRDGKPVVKLKPHEIKKMELSWEHVMMLFNSDLGIEVSNVQRYIMAVCSEVKPVRIMKHKEGYFLIQLKVEKDKDVLLSNGPYYMNWRPIVVKA